MSENSNHLVKMANQIVASIPAATTADKINSAATHMSKFWSPLMKKQIGEYISSGGLDLSPEASEAIKKIV